MVSSCSDNALSCSIVCQHMTALWLALPQEEQVVGSGYGGGLYVPARRVQGVHSTDILRACWVWIWSRRTCAPGGGVPRGGVVVASG